MYDAMYKPGDAGHAKKVTKEIVWCESAVVIKPQLC